MNDCIHDIMNLTINGKGGNRWDYSTYLKTKIDILIE